MSMRDTSRELRGEKPLCFLLGRPKVEGCDVVTRPCPIWGKLGLTRLVLVAYKPYLLFRWTNHVSLYIIGVH